jgi:hypothetical protein
MTPRLFGYDGELYIPGNYCIPMSTIIVSFQTPEGFVIASDGRSRDPETGRIVTEDAQKIFPLQQEGSCLACGVAGAASFVFNGQIFDFKREAAVAAEQIAGKRLKNWWEYVTALTSELGGRLTRLRESLGGRLAKPTETWIFLGGFYGKHQKGAHIHFRHGTTATEFEPQLFPPGFNIPFGSAKIFELLNSEDSRFARYSIPKRDKVFSVSTAIDRAKNDILAHCDPIALTLDETTCAGIGGRIQIATVTRKAGFQWVPGFESR